MAKIKHSNNQRHQKLLFSWAITCEQNIACKITNTLQLTVGQFRILVHVNEVESRRNLECVYIAYRHSHIDPRTVPDCWKLKSYVYTLRLIESISYLGACYIRTKVTKYTREKMTLRVLLSIKSYASRYKIAVCKV